MDFTEFSEFEIKTDFLTPSKVDLSPKIKRVGWKFLRGPIPWTWLSKASKVSEKGLHIAIGLWLIAGMSKKKTVKMQKKILQDLGVTRHAFYRARDKMEEVGLISVERKPGQTHLITLLVDGGEDTTSLVDQTELKNTTPGHTV